jgi:hypothetical protein
MLCCISGARLKTLRLRTLHLHIVFNHCEPSFREYWHTELCLKRHNCWIRLTSDQQPPPFPLSPRGVQEQAGQFPPLGFGDRAVRGERPHLHVDNVERFAP